MNEFKYKNLKDLKIIKECMESYKQGMMDTFTSLESLFQDIRLKTINMWDEKIKQCEEEIRIKNV